MEELFFHLWQFAIPMVSNQPIWNKCKWLNFDWRKTKVSNYGQRNYISHLLFLIFPSSKWPLSGSRKRCNDLNTRRYLCIITVTPIKLNTLGNTLPTNSKKWLAKLESDTRMAPITLVILMRTNALTMVYFKYMICIPYIGASVTLLNSWRISLLVV